MTDSQQTPRSSTAERLRQNRDRVIQLWRDAALHELQAARKQSTPELLDGLPRFLDELADALESGAPERAQEKVDDTAKEHGSHRASSQSYSLEAVLAEFRLLRVALFEVLEENGPLAVRERNIILDSLERGMTLAGTRFASFARSEARMTEQRFRLIFSGVKDHAIIGLDPQGRIMDWNAGAERVTGYRAEEALGQPGAILFTEEDREKHEHEKELQQALCEGKAEDERWHLRKDGRLFFASGSVTPLKEENGELVGFVKIIRDQTERRWAEEERKRLLHELSTTVERITDAFFSVDPEWRIVYMNTAAARITGRSVNELLGKNLWEEFAAAVHTEIHERLQRAMREQVPVHFEAYYPQPLNLWLELYAYPSREGLSVYYRNITERKLLEEESARLHERERSLRLEAERRAAELDAIIDNLPDQIFIGNTKTFVRVNQPALDYMGFDSLEDMTSDLARFPERAQLRDARTGEILPLDDTPFTHALRGERVIRELTHVNLKTGEKRVFIAKATPIRTEDRITGAVAVHIDITDRIRATHRVEALQRITEVGLARATSLQDLMNSLVAILQSTFAGDTAAILLFDHNHGSLLIHAESGLDFSGPQPARFPRFTERVLRANKPILIEDTSKDEDVRELTRELGLSTLLAAPLRFHHEQIGVIRVGYARPRHLAPDDLMLLQVAADEIAIAIENARLYERSLDHVRRLEAERKLREQFVATLSHDLRGPLTSVQMSAHLILRKPGDAEHASRLAHRVIDNITRADKMIRDLLDANRLRAGHRLPLEVVHCDLREVVGAICDDFASVHGQQCRFEVQGASEGYWSPDALRRIMENLLTNAVKYGAPGAPICVRVRGGSGEVELEVNNRLKDKPLTPEERAQLFKPFMRTRAAEASGKMGWGLGLSLVQGLAEAHGGSISVESSEARGTSFTIRLPRDSRPFAGDAAMEQHTH
jgi:PAS domain S-box-containing protein